MKKIEFEEYVRWLAQYRWRWWGGLTFRIGWSVAARCALIGYWIDTIETIERHGISWVAFPERGKKTGNFHFHILIAGISSHIYRHLKSWHQIAGHAVLLKYDRNHPGRYGIRNADKDVENRGLRYAAKSLRRDDGQIYGQLLEQHLLPRFKRHKVLPELTHPNAGRLLLPGSATVERRLGAA